MNDSKSFLKKSIKYFLNFLLAILVISTVGIALLPSLLTTNFGKAKVEKYLESKFNKSFSFQNLEFSLFGPQEIRGLQVNNLDGNPFLHLQEATIETSFPKILFAGLKNSSITFNDLDFQIQTSEEDKASTIQFSQVIGSISISPFSLKMKGNTLQDSLKGDFDINLSLSEYDISDFRDLLKDPDVLFQETTDLKAHVIANNFPVQFLDNLYALRSPHNSKHFFSSIFGNKLNLTLNKLETVQKEVLNFEINALSPNLTANMLLDIERDKIYTTKPNTLMLMVNQSLIHELFGNSVSYELNEPTPLLVHLNAFSLPIDLRKNVYDREKMTFKGNIDFQEAKLKSTIGLPEILLQKMNAEMIAKEDSNDLSIKIKGSALEKNHPIEVSLETVLHKSLDFKKHKIPPMLIDLNHIPLQMVDHYFNLNHFLEETVGLYADLKIEAILKKEFINLKTSFKSDYVTLSSMELKIDEDLEMIEPPIITYRIPSGMTERILPESAIFEIDQSYPLKISLELDKISNILNFKDSLPELLSGKITIQGLMLEMKHKNETITFDDIIIPWKYVDDEKAISIQLHGETKSSKELMKEPFYGEFHLRGEDSYKDFDIVFTKENGIEKKSHFTLKGSASNLFDEKGHLNTPDLAIHLNAKIENLPTPLFCKVACFEKSLHQKIKVLFGDTINGNLHVAIQSLNGEIEASVNGNEGSFLLDSYVKNGFLHLNRPFQAKFQVSPRLGKSILHEIFPLLSGVVSSDQPILFAISNEGFSFPLEKFDLSKIEISEAILSLGHVKFDNSGELAKVLSLLTPPDSDLITVWFTPLYFSMQKGTFKLDRVDMLISNQFPIAAWGKINLIQDKVKMKIGMSGYALSHAFKIKGLDKDYMLQIPLIGKVNSATIDKPTATAKIGALIAQGHGGPKGLVLGTVLSLAGGALSEKRPPKPTTYPLPWENELTNESKETPSNEKQESVKTTQQESKSKNRKRKGVKLEQLLENEANTLFEKLFR